MEFIERHKIKFGITFVFIISCLIVISVFYKREENTTLNSIVKAEEIDKENDKSSFFVDIKGAVKKPGVYEMSAGSIVNDVIKLAGGLKKNGTTKNINLSQLVKEEMVIYIFTTSEIKKTTTPIKADTTCTCETIEVNNCITSEISESANDNTNTEVSNGTNAAKKRVNINTASKEELMSVNGVGEAKADAIIIYRQKTKFKTIEDIMNVSGIGEALFAKIKDYITV